MNIGPRGRRLFIALYMSLALVNATLAFGLLAQGRTAMGLACTFISLLESTTASLIWVAAPVRNRW